MPSMIYSRFTPFHATKLLYTEQDLHAIIAAEGARMEVKLEGRDDSKLIFSCTDSLYRYIRYKV